MTMLVSARRHRWIHREALLCALAILLLFGTLQQLSGQEANRRLRVHILPVEPDSDDMTINAAVTTTAETVALTLRLLGEYAVTEVPFGTHDTLEGYLEETNRGDLDRLLFVSISAELGDYVVSSGVIDPLSGELLIDRTAVAEQAVDLFAVTDELLADLLGELSGRRIAFGEVRFERGGWTPGSVGIVDWKRLAFSSDSELTALVDLAVALDIPAGTPSHSPELRFRVGGVALEGEQTEPQRVLVGKRGTTILQRRRGELTPIFREEAEFQDREVTTIRYEIPVITPLEAQELNALIDEVVEAYRVARATGSPESLAHWTDRVAAVSSYCRKLSDSVPVLTELLWRFDLLTIAAEAQGIRYRSAKQWQEPRMQFLLRLADLRREAKKLSETTSPGSDRAARAVVLIDSITGDVADDIAPLYALNALRSLREEDWQALVSEYDRTAGQLESSGFSQPRWLTDDLSFISDAVASYEESYRNRPGLYRALSWGGAALALGGGAGWGIGVFQAQQNEAALDEYRSVTDPTEVADRRTSIEQDQETANLLQAAGIGTAATGVVSFLTGIIVQRRDKHRPEQQLLARLKVYFEPRTQLLAELEDDPPATVSLPLSGFMD